VTPSVGGRSLAGGALTVAVGLTATGAGTVATMALAARALPAPEYAAFAVWWTLATLLGTSFGVFEAYLARLVVTEVAAGRSSRGVTGLIAGRAIVVTSLLALVLLALAPWTASRLLDGNTRSALLLPVFVGLSATQAVQRGAATGHSRFVAVAGQLSTDGVARASLVATLVVVHADSMTAFTVAACTSAALSLFVGGALCPQWLARPRWRGTGVSWGPMLFLLVGSVGPLLVNNGSVPWLAGTHAVSALTLGAFAGAITLSRFPTQFVSAAFGPLLAQLAHTVEVGDRATFDRLRKGADLAACLLGLLFVAGFAVFGPLVLRIYLGPDYRLSVANLTILAAASGLMFVAVVQQASLAALDRWATIAKAWVCGTAAFGAVLVLPLGELSRATVAPFVAVLFALVLMTLTRSGWSFASSRTAAPGEPAGPQLPDRTD
jgi:O-antigen/teichoic acid export membrane protein